MEKILDNAALHPIRCDVFKEEVLYFFYGPIFYRPKKTRVLDEIDLNLPVAFIFAPSSLNHARDYYPFDTGAASTGRLGHPWTTKLGKQLRVFRIPSESKWETAARIVSTLFADNKSYWEGKPNPSLKRRRGPLSTLHAFYKCNLMDNDVDRRKNAIECQFRTKLPLCGNLIWVAYPVSKEAVYGPRIYELTKPNTPKIHTYDYTSHYAPAEYATVLEHEAKIYCQQYF